MSMALTIAENSTTATVGFGSTADGTAAAAAAAERRGTSPGYGAHHPAPAQAPA